MMKVCRKATIIAHDRKNLLCMGNGNWPVAVDTHQLTRWGARISYGSIEDSRSRCGCSGCGAMPVSAVGC